MIIQTINIHLTVKELAGIFGGNPKNYTQVDNFTVKRHGDSKRTAAFYQKFRDTELKIDAPGYKQICKRLKKGQITHIPPFLISQKERISKLNK